MKYICASILLLFSITVIADNIYEYTDKNGTTVFTNKSVKNAKKVALPPLTVYAAPMTQRDLLGKAAASSKKNTIRSQPSGYARNANLGTNEQGRNQILNEELSRERQALNDTQQALLTGKQTKLASEKDHPELYQARIQSLQDAVTEHQKNIDILSKQLGVNN